MAFGDDFEDMGIDLGEEENLAVMTFTFENDYNARKVMVQKEIPSVDVYYTLYLPPDERSVHSKFVGHSPDGKKHYRYHADYGDKSFDTALYYFEEADWIIIYDSEHDIIGDAI